MHEGRSLHYPFAEFVDAFRYAGTQTDGSQSGRQFMTSWFAKRYPERAERAEKFAVFMLIADYLTVYRAELDNAHAIVMGSEESGDLVTGVITNLLLNHFCVDRTPPKPDQLIRAYKKHIDARLKKNA